MRELFSDRDPTRIGYYQSLLEAAGVATHVRNRDLATMMGTEVPIPDFFPSLCVVEDGDYDRALGILRELAEDGDPAAEKLPHQTKGIVALGVCGICAMLIAGAILSLFGGANAVESVEDAVPVVMAMLVIAGASAGIWAVLRSYRQTRLREAASRAP